MYNLLEIKYYAANNSTRNVIMIVEPSVATVAVWPCLFFLFADYLKAAVDARNA